LIIGGAEQIALGPVVTGIAEAILEAGVERNRVQRHLNADRSRKLRPHAAHALARRSLALRRFALDHEHVAASLRREVIGDARADDPSTSDDDFRSLHMRIDPNDSAF
jgi:hypothetical protein